MPVCFTHISLQGYGVLHPLIVATKLFFVCFQESNKSWKKCLLYRHVILLISGLVILITRWRLMGSMTPTFQVFDNPHSFVNGSIYRVRKTLLIFIFTGSSSSIAMGYDLSHSPPLLFTLCCVSCNFLIPLHCHL